MKVAIDFKYEVKADVFDGTCWTEHVKTFRATTTTHAAQVMISVEHATGAQQVDVKSIQALMKYTTTTYEGGSIETSKRALKYSPLFIPGSGVMA